MFLSQHSNDGRVGKGDGGGAKELSYDDEQADEEEDLVHAVLLKHLVAVLWRYPVFMFVLVVVVGEIDGLRRHARQGSDRARRPTAAGCSLSFPERLPNFSLGSK